MLSQTDCLVNYLRVEPTRAPVPALQAELAVALAEQPELAALIVANSTMRIEQPKAKNK